MFVVLRSRQGLTMFLRAICWVVACASIALPLHAADDLAFRRHVINADSEFMAAAVFDVNKDGKLDIACGGFWYEGPTWKKHFLRNVEIRGGRPDGYAHQLLDVNGDGWPDIVTVNWRSSSIKWIEHPGLALAQGAEWKAHTIAVPGASETGRLVDLLGDGTPVILPCGSNFAAWWELQHRSNAAGETLPDWIRHDLPPELAGHGVGSGDLNGDGRLDIIGHSGWAEAPLDRRKGRWIWHPDFELDQASIPILVVDVDGDGLNDIVWTHAHDFGIYWLQQTRTPDGRIHWTKHTIDSSLPGAHAPLWEDLDGDGVKELIVGRRYLAHEGRDPAEYDPLAAYRYQFDRVTRTWKRWLISYDDGICFGLDPKAVDLTGSGRKDLVLAGRHGLYRLENLGKGNSLALGLTKNPLWHPSHADHKQLMVVKDEAGHTRQVTDQFDWGRRRAHILAAIQDVLGVLPDSAQRPPLEMKVEGETSSESFLRKKITFASDLQSRVSAYLLVPRKLTRNAAAVIVLHDNLSPAGKDEPGGPAALEYAEELASRGYVCLVPDNPLFGRGAARDDKPDGQYASGCMKAVWDNIRGIDLLETIPEISYRKIGIVGHGLGGLNALLTAAFDSRISAVVSSCGFTNFTHCKVEGFSEWSKARLAPRIHSKYADDPSKIPFDFGELLGTLAPRAVYVIAPLGDRVMDVAGVKEAWASAAPVYQLKRAANALRVAYPEGDRDFSKASRAEAYSWLDQRLKR